ncbi:MAG: nucleotidyltransferase domain-containing protein [Myxococcota bacterium]
MILFGSRARDEHVDTSDYDVAVVSPDFAGVAPVERSVAILRGWRGHRGLDAVGLTPAELAEPRSPLCQAILREGRVVWSCNPNPATES